MLVKKSVRKGYVVHCIIQKDDFEKLSFCYDTYSLRMTLKSNNAAEGHCDHVNMFIEYLNFTRLMRSENIRSLKTLPTIFHRLFTPVALVSFITSVERKGENVEYTYHKYHEEQWFLNFHFNSPLTLATNRFLDYTKYTTIQEHVKLKC